MAPAIIVRIYCLLRDGTTYAEPGGNCFDERDKRGTCRRLTAWLERLGYHVSLTPLSAD